MAEPRRHAEPNNPDSADRSESAAGSDIDRTPGPGPGDPAPAGPGNDPAPNTPGAPGADPAKDPGPDTTPRPGPGADPKPDVRKHTAPGTPISADSEERAPDTPGGAESAPDAPNVAQLKRQHETGAHRDKVAYPDPGASPLGTDDEAAGRPAEHERERVAMSAAGAAKGEKPFEPLQSAPRADPQDDPAPRVDTSGRFQLIVFGGALAVIIAALVIRMLLT